MIREIEAKTILIPLRDANAWFGVRYTMNIYRGCEHQCIYCDSRSLCYGIEDFRDVLVKANAVQRLEAELTRKRRKGTIGTGSMSDPYTHAERHYNLTGRALEVIARHGYPVHITTKSDMVTRDLATLREINRTWASVSFTLTTTSDELARAREPGAPLPSARLAAMRALAQAGIYTGTTMMPILPFIEDNEENVRAVVERTHEAGGRYVIPWLGMSLRDRQREYYYRELDRLFPGLRPRYEARLEHCSCRGWYDGGFETEWPSRGRSRAATARPFRLKSPFRVRAGRPRRMPRMEHDLVVARNGFDGLQPPTWAAATHQNHCGEPLARRA